MSRTCSSFRKSSLAETCQQPQATQRSKTPPSQRLAVTHSQMLSITAIKVLALTSSMPPTVNLNLARCKWHSLITVKRASSRLLPISSTMPSGVNKELSVQIAWPTIRFSPSHTQTQTCTTGMWIRDAESPPRRQLAHSLELQKLSRRAGILSSNIAISWTRSPLRDNQLPWTGNLHRLPLSNFQLSRKSRNSKQCPSNRELALKEEEPWQEAGIKEPSFPRSRRSTLLELQPTYNTYRSSSSSKT